MSFFKNLKNAFGFSDDPISNDIDGGLNYDEAEKREPYINPFKPATPAEPLKPSPAAPLPPQATEPVELKPHTVNYDLPEGFLNSIIAIVNANLPQIVKDCIDIEAEKKAITQSIGTHFKSAIDDIHQAACEQATAMWTAERNKISEQLAQATQAAEDSSRRAEEAKQKCQVEEAKRKALKEQAASLEQRVATLEAEHEQYLIENKSLLNKMKVMQVYADDAAAYKDMADQSDKQLAALRAELEGKVNELKEANARADKATADAVDARNAASTANETAEAAIKAGEELLAQAEAEKEHAEKRIADAREAADALIEQARTEAEHMVEVARKEAEASAAKAKAATDEAASLAAELTTTRSEAETSKIENEIATEEIAKLKQEIEARNHELETAKAELAEAHSTIEMMDEIERQLKHVEDFKAQKNAETRELKSQIQDLQSHNESIAATAQTASAEAARLREELQATRTEAEQNVLRVMQERDAAVKRLSMERAEALKQAADELARVEDEKNHLLDIKEDEKLRAIEEKETEITNLIASKNAEIEQNRHELLAETDKVRNELREMAKERDRIAGKLAAEQRDRKSDVAFYEQKIKFLSADQKRLETELRAEIAKLQEQNAQLEARQAPKSTGREAAIIDNDIAEAVAQTFGFDSSITGDNAPGSDIVAEPAAPQIPNYIFDNDTFSDDSIDATFQTDAQPAADTEPTHANEPTMEELADIDWLMPTPPSRPETKSLSDLEEAPEAKPAKKPAEEPHKKPDAQMSLF